jgi:hypothetical protein
MTDAETLARRFHETYERLAPDFGYETRPESAKPWDQVPENNRALMIAVCESILTELPRPRRRQLRVCCPGVLSPPGHPFHYPGDRPDICSDCRPEQPKRSWWRR